MALNDADQARVDYHVEVRNALMAGGFADSEALDIIIAEIESGVSRGSAGGPSSGLPPGPVIPNLESLAGTWTLGPSISIDCGSLARFELRSSQVEISFASDDRSRVSLTFSPTQTANGTVSDLGEGKFELFATFPVSQARCRFHGSWSDTSGDAIDAVFRFEFGGTSANTFVGGIFGGTPCRDAELPTAMVRV